MALARCYSFSLSVCVCVWGPAAAMLILTFMLTQMLMLLSIVSCPPSRVHASSFYLFLFNVQLSFIFFLSVTSHVERRFDRCMFFWADSVPKICGKAEIGTFALQTPRTTPQDPHPTPPPSSCLTSYGAFFTSPTLFIRTVLYKYITWKYYAHILPNG